MKKDIDFYQAKDMQIVAVPEWDKDFLAQHWNVYLINNSNTVLETTLVLTRGNSDTKKTSTLRYNLKDVAPKTSVKIEFIQEEVIGFTNEYLVTYFKADKLHEKKFVFKPHSISEKNTSKIEVMGVEGVVAN